MTKLGSEYYDKEYFDDPSTTKSNYGKLSGGYTEKVYKPFKQQQAIQIIQELGYTSQWKPDNILVVGCAKGFLVAGIQKLGIICEGIDISEYVIKESKSYTENCKIGDICDMSEYKDESFEVVICLETLEHIKDELPDEPDGDDRTLLHRAMDELCRVAQRYVVITTPEGDDTKHHDKSKEGDDPSHFSVFPPDWWKLEFSKRKFIPDYFQISGNQFEKTFFMICKRV